jgi:hypothetical protein
MAEFTKEGILSTSGTVLHTGATPVSTTVLSKVLILRFNNPSAYGLKLEKYNVSTLVTTTIYDLSLSAGDTVTDNLTYALAPGDELIATSDIVGTTYYIYGLDY